MMQTSIIKDALKECSEISNEIMNNVKSILDKENIEYEENNNFELIIKDNNKKNIINKLIENISEKNIKLLLQITEVKNNVIIRQKSY